MIRLLLIIVNHRMITNLYSIMNVPLTLTSTIVTISTFESSIVDQSETREEQLAHVIRKKKRSQEAIHHLCRKRNIIKRADRHDFDIIRTIYLHFKIQQVEQVLDNLNIRCRHYHIRRHYQLHVGLHSSEEKTRFDMIIYSTNNILQKLTKIENLDVHRPHRIVLSSQNRTKVIFVYMFSIRMISFSPFSPLLSLL